MLKKQTVWLLTMLSLMIVLSVYYVMSPNNDDLAYVNDGKKNTEETSKASETEGKASVDDVTNLGKDELFTTIRMDLEDERSMKKSRLKDIVASTDASAAEKNKALEEMDELENVTTKEQILEETIQSNNNYPDVLVRSEGDKVHVHVKTDKLDNKEVLDIMQEVRAEFERDVTVDVNFQGYTADEKE
ncbi:SpoIIIAH-like family protein [Virgibacillus halophilus]|uniref:SpoIIIAH-like family protein n=1 Tax=Tigheibacillus halophilus TaxID=361280 RepID=UPI0036290FC5